MMSKEILVLSVATIGIYLFVMIMSFLMLKICIRINNLEQVVQNSLFRKNEKSDQHFEEVRDID